MAAHGPIPVCWSVSQGNTCCYVPGSGELYPHCTGGTLKTPQNILVHPAARSFVANPEQNCWTTGNSVCCHTPGEMFPACVKLVASGHTATPPQPPRLRARRPILRWLRGW